MPLHIAQPIALYLLMFCSLGTVLSSGLFSPALAAAAIVLALGSLAVPFERRERLAKSSWQGVVLVVVFIALAVRVVTGQADIISGATLFLIAVLLSRLYTPRGPHEATQILMLSLLVVLAGSALSTSFGFAPYFIGFVVCSVWALTTTQLTKESVGRRSQLRISGRFLFSTSLLALFIFAQTTAFFLFFPRFGVSMLQLKNRPQKGTIGFTDHVDLGAAVDLEPDESVVLRLDFGKGLPATAPETMYFRGTTLVTFDGVHWGKPDISLKPLRESADDLFHLRDLRNVSTFNFYQEATESDVVFLPEPTAAFGFSREARLATAVSRIKFFVGSTGEVSSFKPSPMALRFTALLSAEAELAQDPPPPAASELPANTNPELRTLAEQWTAGAGTTHDKVVAISHELATQFHYTSNLHAPPAGRDPLSFFLFDEKAGHCEYFASALAVLLRIEGVPTRLVNGYFGAALNQYGHYYAVTESRAHTWVEYWDGGWHRADPTASDSAAEKPSRMTQMVDVMRYRWSRYVVDFDLDLQVQGLQAAKHFFSKPAPTLPFTAADAAQWYGEHRTNILLVSALVLLLWLYWLRSRYIYAKITAPTRLYRRFERVLRRRGVTRGDGEGPLHFARAVAHAHPALAADAERFTDAYVAARFGGELSVVPTMRRALRNIERMKR